MKDGKKSTDQLKEIQKKILEYREKNPSQFSGKLSERDLDTVVGGVLFTGSYRDIEQSGLASLETAREDFTNKDMVNISNLYELYDNNQGSLNYGQWLVKNKLDSLFNHGD